MHSISRLGTILLFSFSFRFTFLLLIVFSFHSLQFNCWRSASTLSASQTHRGVEGSEADRGPRGVESPQYIFSRTRKWNGNRTNICRYGIQIQLKNAPEMVESNWGQQSTRSRPMSARRFGSTIETDNWDCWRTSCIWIAQLVRISYSSRVDWTVMKCISRRTQSILKGWDNIQLSLSFLMISTTIHRHCLVKFHLSRPNWEGKMLAEPTPPTRPNHCILFHQANFTRPDRELGEHDPKKRMLRDSGITSTKKTDGNESEGDVDLRATLKWWTSGLKTSFSWAGN